MVRIENGHKIAGGMLQSLVEIPSLCMRIFFPSLINGAVFAAKPLQAGPSAAGFFGFFRVGVITFGIGATIIADVNRLIPSRVD